MCCRRVSSRSPAHLQPKPKTTKWTLLSWVLLRAHGRFGALSWGLSGGETGSSLGFHKVTPADSTKTPMIIEGVSQAFVDGLWQTGTRGGAVLDGLHAQAFAVKMQLFNKSSKSVAWICKRCQRKILPISYWMESYPTSATM